MQVFNADLPATLSGFEKAEREIAKLAIKGSDDERERMTAALAVVRGVTSRLRKHRDRIKELDRKEHAERKGKRA